MNRNLCKKVLEEHFKVPFRRTMVNGYVIDFYNKDLMIGLMYNSIHHYNYSPKFHKIHSKFIASQNRDILRREACLMMGIKLITIPYDVVCVVGTIKRRLMISNDCRCRDCLYMTHLLYDPIWIKQTNENYSK